MYLRAFIHIYIRTYTYINTYVHMHTCTHTHIYIHTLTYTYARTHTYTALPQSRLQATPSLSSFASVPSVPSFPSVASNASLSSAGSGGGGGTRLSFSARPYPRGHDGPVTAPQQVRVLNTTQLKFLTALGLI